MQRQHRVLPAHPFVTLDEYFTAGGGIGLENARELLPGDVIDELDDAGLRGRGGAGFPTGRKWRTVAANASEVTPATVVVNGAEGEPGTFKDRSILMANPYAVIEGALIAAHAVGAARVVFAVKPDRGPGVARLRAAIDEMVEVKLHEGVELDVFEGPHAYLYGEETALLESLGGAPPFPRVAPPYRRGVGELDEPGAHFDDSVPAADAAMAGPTDATDAPPALVDNVETLANVPGILAHGATWFRMVGTDASPGTIVCTVSGSVAHAGVGEVAMGTPLADVIDDIGGGPRRGRSLKAVLSGVSNALIPAEALGTALTYEAMQAAGSGLGSCGFLVFDDSDDIAAAVAGVSRFLAIESCGQCTACKQDGRALADLLAGLARNDQATDVLDAVRGHASTITDGARCYLATQHQVVVTSLLDRFAADVHAHIDGTTAATDPMLIAELVVIEDGQVVIDQAHARKQPDWSYDELDSGQSPADRRDELVDSPSATMAAHAEGGRRGQRDSAP
jgi:NADH-quinone oxidoreductase subunit F